jgi:hypothetical protein
MDPAILKQLAIGALVPGFLSTLLFALAFLVRQPADARTRTPLQRLALLASLVLPPLALTIVYLISHPIVFGLPQSLTGSFNRLPIAAALAAPLGLLWLFSIPAAIRWPATIATLIALPISIGSPMGHWNDPARLSILTIASFALLASISIAASTRLATKTKGTTSALLLLIPAAGASQLLVLGFHSLSLAQVAGIAAATAGGALAISLIRPNFSLRTAAAPIAVFTTFAMLQGVLFTETPYAPLLAALIALSPAAALPITRQGLKFNLARLALATLPIAIAMAITLAQSAPEASDY